MPDTTLARSPLVDQKIVIFGDSLSDNGNLFEAGEGVISDDFREFIAGFDGRASNGPTFAEYLGSAFGFGSEANYAVAGGEVLGTQTLGQFIVEADAEAFVLVSQDDPRLLFDMNLGAQINRFEAATAGQDISLTTGFILAGGNDYQNINGNVLTFPFNAVATLNSTVDATLAAARDLLEGGMGRVVISGLPSAQFLPLVADQGSLLASFADFIVDRHNSALFEGVAQMRNNGMQVEFLDLSIVTDAILEDGSMFGFLAPQQLTLREGDPAELALFSDDQVAFWDPIHPTAAAHAVIAQFTEAYFTRQVTELGPQNNSATFDDDGHLVFSYSGADTIVTGAGDDLVFGGTGADSLEGGAGDDLLAGGRDNDVISGGAGSDIIADGFGNDVTSGGAGDDIIIDGLGNDTHSGGEGNDTFVFIDETLNGRAITGTPPSNFFDGGGGNDRLIAVVSASVFADLEGAETIADYLSLLGITASNIERFELFEGIEDFQSAYGDLAVFETVDQWGLI